MKVLYVNHTSRMSGAERSLLELITLTAADRDVLLACPAGELTERAHALGIPTVELGSAEIGFSSGLRSATVRILRSGLQVRALARRAQVEVIHAASPRAGLLVACCVLSPPRRVVDVRDVLPRGPKATVVRWALRLTADLIVFNSTFTRVRFGPVWPARATIVHPRVDIAGLLGRPLPSPIPEGSPPVLGVLGQITPWKGQDDAIRILALIRSRFPTARLRIIGSVVFTGDSVAFDNEAFSRELPALAADLAVADSVELAGANEDLGAVFSSLDILLVPSWEEPFGRVVAEGMAAGVPVVATLVGGPSELIEDGVSGFLAPPRNPAAWVEPVTRLLEDRDLARRVATSARERITAVLDGPESSDVVRSLYPDTTANDRPTQPVATRRLR